MPVYLIAYLVKYGYVVIFVLCFLAELGVPIPFPNELTLMYAGYQSSLGHLSLPLIIAVAAIADISATTILYLVFYFVGDRIMRSRLRWIPRAKIRELTLGIEEDGRWAIYIGRLLPYVRGYTSVAAGLLNIPPRIFIPTIVLSAITWASAYAIGGKLLGHKYAGVITTFSSRELMFATVAVFVVVLFVLPQALYLLRSKWRAARERITTK